jgi:PKD repeat protein
MRRSSLYGVATALVALAASTAQAQDVRIAVPAQQRPAENGLFRAGALTKVGTHLSRAFLEYQLAANQGRAAAFRPSDAFLVHAGGRVLVDARANGSGDALLADLERLGLTRGARAGQVVSGFLPLAALGDAAALTSLRSIVASRAPIRNTGSITSQGDFALRADTARSLHGVDGTGVTVGVVSDSYNALGGAAADVASGDLPLGGVPVIGGESPYCGTLIFCTDEGRAMLQIVHDIAPGAGLLFHNGLGGIAEYAAGLEDLAAAGADVIVDDLMYLNEPWFQDGVIAQAVDSVVGSGIAYYSAAGNSGRKSMEMPFNDSGVIFCIEFFYPIGDCDPLYERVGRMHDFDPGPGVDLYQNITIPINSVLTVAMQWNQPFGGPGPVTDHDIVLLDQTGGIYFDISANDNVTTGEGWEVIQFQNDEVLGYGDQFSLIITYDDVDSVGPPATLVKTIIFGGGTFNEHDTHSPTLVGHANANGAQAVGAAFFADTPAYGVSPPIAEAYSSAGGVPILFNTHGVALASPEVRAKPAATATDGVNTTFFFSDSYGGDGIDDFFGTSAAAPHAAGVAALMLDASPGATPAQVLSAMQNSAVDMAAAGFDNDTGAGLIQADSAIAALLAGGGNAPPSASFDTTISALQVQFTDTSNDADGSVVAWSWSFGDGNTSSLENPLHVYATAGTYDVTLTVTDNDGAVGSSGRAVTVTDGSGGSNTPPTASFSYSCSSLDCSFDGTLSSDDAGIVSYAWDFGDGTGSVLSAPSHSYASQGTYTVTLSVVDTDAETDSVSVSLRVKNRGGTSGSVGGGGGSGGGGGTTGGSEKGAKKCSDGIDNDGDGLIDGADPDCQ